MKKGDSNLLGYYNKLSSEVYNLDEILVFHLEMWNFIAID